MLCVNTTLGHVKELLNFWQSQSAVSFLQPKYVHKFNTINN